MIFQTITKHLVTSSLEVNISNLEISMDHWASGDKILSFAKRLEGDLISNKGQFEKVTIDNALLISKDNPRISNILFFSHEVQPNLTVILIVSDVPTFRTDNFLKRQVEISLLKQGKKFTLVEITKGEYSFIKKEKDGFTFPKEWILLEELTKKYETYQLLFG